MTNLLDIQKPVRYIGKEWNAVTSKPEARVRFAFAYPDVYEVGMSFLGLQIIYGLLNEQPWIWCERAFAPWPDLEKEMREKSELLQTLESDTPLKHMDILGFSLQHEMMYTNVLTMLDLSGIPLQATERSDGHPIVIAGGPSAYNPMPMVDFIDAFVIGEAEEVLREFCQCYDVLKSKNASRQEILEELGKIEGVFVPTVYDYETNRYGETFPCKPKNDQYPDLIEKRVISDFENSFYPTKQLLPNTKVIHHRLALEVMRGCPGGCRFCQAGYTDRPVRERSPERLLKDAEAGLKQTGFNEIGLLSLSTADYTQLPSLCSGMIQEYYPQRVSLSLPSLRIDSFPARVTQEIGKVRNTGLTFAPEAGTERLRWAINKLIYDADIYSKVRESVTSNQDTVKFYFMVGLPTETDEDLQGIVNMIANIKKILKESGKKRANIHVGLSPFVPKPHTAYQWYGQISKEEIQRRVRFVSSQLKPMRVKVNWHDPDKSLVEGALARGDARLGSVIRYAYENGARFDEWGEYFSIELWDKAFQVHGLSLNQYAEKTYEKEDLLPWQLISVRVSTRYLWREWEKTFREKESRHCGNEMCRVCKVCDGDELVTVHAVDDKPAPTSRYNMEHDLASELTTKQMDAPPEEEGRYRYNICFNKSKHLVYASHHDLMMLFESLFRRAGIQLAYSEGFHPHPKIVFASALPVGVESKHDYLEITTIKEYEIESLLQHLNSFCSEGLQIVDIAEVNPQEKKITARLKAFHYEVEYKIGEDLKNCATILGNLLQHPEFKDELRLARIEAKRVEKSKFTIDYICESDGGKYAKPLDVAQTLSRLLGIDVVTEKITRLDIYSLDRHGHFVPLIPRETSEFKQKDAPQNYSQLR